MSIHNIHFQDKIGTNPKLSLNICFLELLEEFPRDSKKPVRIGHGKQIIGVRVIKVLL